MAYILDVRLEKVLYQTFSAPVPSHRQGQRSKVWQLSLSEGSLPVVKITDADGRFEFKQPLTNGLLVSFGQRKLADVDEIDCWIVPPEGDQVILLNNRNMTRPEELLGE